MVASRGFFYTKLCELSARVPEAHDNGDLVWCVFYYDYSELYALSKRINDGHYTGLVIAHDFNNKSRVPHSIWVTAWTHAQRTSSWSVIKSQCSGCSDYYWIKAFLFDRRQRVVVGEAVSEWVRVKSGVLQGSMLGFFLTLSY